MPQYKPKLSIPVVTVDNDEYTTPTFNDDGRLVVSAKTVKQGANVVLDYDPLNNKYTPINPHTASLDYNIKARSFESILRQQEAEKANRQKLYADPNNTRQVNSWIDTLFTPDPFSSLAYLIKDYTVDPLLSKDLTFVEKTTALVNNAVVNLADTMDYVVGQSAVRGGIQGAIEGGLPKAWENIKWAITGDAEKGRPTFEWNIDTGRGWIDAGVNIFLEVITDPSNLISFGTKSAIKRIGKDAFTSTILKSADDVGIVLAKSQADELANAAIKTYLYKGDDLAKALQNSKIGRYANSPELVEKFFMAVTDNAKNMSEAKTLNLLRAVRTGTDELQQNVMRVVGATSGLGLGYYTTKGIIKGVDTASYAVSKINNVLKNVDYDNITLRNSGEVFEGISTKLNRLRDVVDLGENFSARTVRRATKTFQEAKYAELDKILRKGTKSSKLIQELDTWAIKEGFENVMDMLDKIKYIRSAIPETVLSLYDNLNTAITRKVAHSIKDVVVPLKNLIDADILRKNTPEGVTSLLQGVRALEATPYMQGYIGSEMFKKVYNAVEHSTILKNIDAVQPKIDTLHAYVRTALDTGLDVTADEYNEIKKIVLTLLDDPLLSKISSESDAFLRTSAFRQSMLKNVFGYTDEELKDFLEYTLESIFKWERDIDAFKTLFKEEYNVPVNVIQSFYDVLDSVDTTLDNLIHSLGDKTRMRTDKIIGTLQSKNTSNVIVDSVSRAIESEGGLLDDVLIELNNVSNTIIDSALADEVYTDLLRLTELLDNMKLDDYFTREGGLWHLLGEWDSHGLSIESAKEIQSRLEALISKQTTDVGGVRTTIENVYNSLTTLVESVAGTQEVATKELETKLAKALESIIYRVKLSHVQTLDMLLTTPGVSESFADINSSTGLGDLFNLLNDTADTELGVEAVNFLKGLAKSTEVGNKVLSLVEGSALPREWKNALYDTLAGKVRVHISDIDNYYAVANDLAIRSKMFIDNNNNAHMSRLNALTNTGDTLEEATTLHKFLFGAVKTNDLGKAHASFWNSVTDVLAKDYHKTFNITYSAGQTGHKAGDIYELSVVLPNGQSYKFVDINKLKMFRDTVSEQTARKLYGKSKQQVKELLDNNLVKYRGQDNVYLFDTTEDFAVKVFEFFQGVKDASRKANLSPRIIGYNTAYDSKNTNTILHNFMRTHELSTYVSKYHVDHKLFSGVASFDAAQYVRMRFEGAVTITDDIANEFDGIAKKAKEYLEYANAGDENIKATLMPDFNRRATKSLRDVRDMLDEALGTMKNNGKAPNPLMLSEVQYKALVTRYTEQELVGMRHQIAGLLENLGETLSNIAQVNNELGQDLIVMDNLARLSGEHNIMQILNKYMINRDGVSALSFKTFYNPAVYMNWFKGGDGKFSASLIEHRYDTADKLTRQLNRIKHPMLLYEIESADLKQVRGYLAEKFAKTDSAKFSSWGQDMLHVTTETDKLQDFIISKTYFDNIIKTMSEDEHREFLLELYNQTNDVLLIEYFRFTDDFIFNNGPTRTLGVDIFHSQAVKDSNKIITLLDEVKDVNAMVKKIEVLQDELILQSNLRDTYGMSLPSTNIKEKLIRDTRDFIGNVNATLSASENKFKELMNNATTAQMRYTVRQAYTEEVEQVLEVLEHISTVHARNRVKTILSLDAEEYAKFLYKHSQGVQIIDLSADMFKNADDEVQGLLIKFMDMLRNGEGLGLRYVEGVDADELYVYLDKAHANLDLLKNSTKDYVLKMLDDTGYDTGSDIVNAYLNHVRSLDEAMSGVFSTSTHHTMTYSRFDELMDYLPDVVKNNMLSEEYLTKNDMIANKFAQTIVGDYGSGVGRVFSSTSSNLMTNTSSTLNHVYKNLRGKDIYKSLFYNAENSLRTWVESTSRLGKLEYKEVYEAINNANMVVAEYVEGRVKQVDISTPAKYARALESGAVLLDYLSYTRSVEVLNDNQISSTLIKNMNKPLRWIKVGQLMSAGWVLRNIPDSTIKGWVQAGLDPMYMTAMFTRTKHIINNYHRVYAEMFKKYNGVINTINVTDYFDTVKNAPIPKDLFTKMLTFYSNSASSPTAQQLDLYRNMAGTLYKRVKGINGIKEADVRKTLDIFKKFPTYAGAKEQLVLEFPQETAKVLLSLRRYVPEQEIGKDFFDTIINSKLSPTHWIMKGNNEFEAFIRMHTFLYHTEYTNGSVAEAIKMVDMSQFNRSRDTKGMKVLEMLFPFSSFQLDNAIFWSEALAGNRNNVAALTEDVISGMYDSEEIDVEELSRNMSLDYLFMSGNLILDEDKGTTLKLNGSIHGVLQLLSNPIGSFSEMFNMPIEVTKNIITAINADPEAYKEDSYNNPKPLSMWEPEDWTEELLQLIPLVGVVYQRYNTAFDRRTYSDAVLPLVFPSVFGVVKTDEAGTTYESRPVGYDWYNQSEEYKKTHRFVFGVSYVPKWMKSDRKTYADTLTRLLQMGYSREDAVDMMQTGWYMKAPDYLLKQFRLLDDGTKLYRSPSEGITSKQYADGSWEYSNTVKGTAFGQDAQGNWKGSNNKLRAYRQRQAGPRKNVKSFKLRFNEPINYSSDRYNYDDWKYYRYKKPRRVYRPTIYSNLFTRNGSSRLAMVKYRGANRSSRQVLRDRSISSRIRTQRIIHQVRGW